MSSFTGTQSVQGYARSWNGTSGVYGTWTTGWLSANNGTRYTEGLAKAEAVIVYWRATDLSSFPAGYAASLGQAIGLTPPWPTSQTSASDPGRPRFSPGAIAGISVGVVTGLMTMISLVVFLMWRRRKTLQTQKLMHPGLPEFGAERSVWKRFHRGMWRAELHHKVKPQEADSRAVHVMPGPPRELEAGLDSVVQSSHSTGPRFIDGLRLARGSRRHSF